jgi:hypothetical protein
MELGEGFYSILCTTKIRRAMEFRDLDGKEKEGEKEIYQSRERLKCTVSALQSGFMLPLVSRISFPFPSWVVLPWVSFPSWVSLAGEP